MRKKWHPHGRRRGLGPGSQPAVSSPAPGLLGGGVVFLPHPACRAAAASGRRPHPARVLGGCRVCGGRRRPQQARVTASLRQSRGGRPKFGGKNECGRGGSNPTRGVRRSERGHRGHGRPASASLSRGQSRPPRERAPIQKAAPAPPERGGPRRRDSASRQIRPRRA